MTAYILLWVVFGIVLWPLAFKLSPASIGCISPSTSTNHDEGH